MAGASPTFRCRSDPLYFMTIRKSLFASGSLGIVSTVWLRRPSPWAGTPAGSVATREDRRYVIRRADFGHGPNGLCQDVQGSVPGRRSEGGGAGALRACEMGAPRPAAPGRRGSARYSLVSAIEYSP